MNIFVMLFGLAALPANVAATHDQPFWAWNQHTPTGVIDIDLIRADVKVVRREGPVEIRIVRLPGTGRASEVKIAASQVDDILNVRDLYPTRVLAGRAECLPPLDERGDFWHDDVRFAATIWAPPAIQVTVRVKDGQVEGVD